MNFKLGLIGAGNIAKAHIAAAADLQSVMPGLRITAIADPVSASAEAMAVETGARAYADLTALLAECPAEDRPDALVVCTPPSARVDVVRQALAAGMPVLIEKPPAHTVTHTEQLLKMSQDHPDLPCLIGFCHRFTPAVDTIIEQVNAGLIGDVVRYENTFAANLPHLQDAWMSDPQISGGGSLIDTGLHSIDLFRYLFGDASLEGAVLRQGWPGRGESNATILLSSTPEPGAIRDATGVAGAIACGWAEATRFTLSVVGTLGTLSYDFEDACVLRHTTTQGEVADLEVQTHEVRFARQMQAFIDACQNGSTAQPVCGFDQGLEAMRLIADAANLDAGRATWRETKALTPQIVQRQPAPPAAVVGK
ncbi:MAG: Gfo/Idh/MocA family oxidoreductase [Planctomycetota bacterium]